MSTGSLYPDRFILESPFEPMGDQPEAIEQISQAFQDGKPRMTLLGITGSGKTFVAANIIAKLNKPTLVIAHNKTLAAQLYAEFKGMFPQNAVEYYVSFYDYYQPESYLPTKDLYISKDFSINEEIDKLRNSTVRSLAERHDVLVVASVSAIYNAGLPEAYRNATIPLEVGMEMARDDLLLQLIKLQYQRNEIDFKKKTFRAKGDRIQIRPIYQEEGITVDFFGDEIDRISLIDSTNGKTIKTLDRLVVYPATNYITREEMIQDVVAEIRADLVDRENELLAEHSLVAAERIVQRTKYDIEQLETSGYCPGIENYSKYFDGRRAGDPPYTLLDHFPKDFFLVVDESHQTLSQVHAMYGGDFSRKLNLVNYGFRLPSAYDNRPLRWEEFEARMPQTLFMSATPGDYEIRNSPVVELIIRPTGLVDPQLEVRKTENQVDDLLGDVDDRVAASERVLITTLTKRMAEDLADYMIKAGYKARYMHSDIDTLERIQILNELRSGEIDILIGINLLREGLDLPEVSLVCILDADKEGFLRSYRSLIQTIGRAARNTRGKVILYADSITESMQQAISENNRRRQKQMRYNKQHGIVPKTIVKGLFSVLDTLRKTSGVQELDVSDEMSSADINGVISDLTHLMDEAAMNLEFELAAEFRDKIKELKQMLVADKNN